MSERYIVVEGWEKFQHRDAARAQVPTWIKVYTELMSKDGFLELSFHLRGVLLSMWLEYAASKRQLRDNTVTLSRRLGQRVTRRDLERLTYAGFIGVSASNPASNHARGDASLEKRREEKEQDTNKDHEETNGADPLLDEPVIRFAWEGVLRDI